MSDFSSPRPNTLPQFIHTYSVHSGMMELNTGIGLGSPASLTWVANLAQYVPVVIPWPYPVRRVFWNNGSSATGNRDFAIYTDDGVRIYHTGAVAGSGTSAPQYVDVADFILPPGRYYFGYSNAGTTNVAWGNPPTVPMLRMAGVLQQATAHPLPATITPAVAAQAVYQFCGITRTESGF